MNRTGLAAASLLAMALVLPPAADAAWKTSEAEGRKYSKRHVNRFAGREFRNLNWEIRECWRIGRQGAGLYGFLPGGVVCRFSAKQRYRAGNVCWLVEIAVKQRKRIFETAYLGSYLDRASLDYCNHAAEWQKPIGARGEPL